MATEKIVPVLIIILVAIIIISTANKCPLALSVDLSNGTRFKNETILNEDINYPSDVQFYYEGKIRGCVCKIKPCVRKCCGKGYAMINRTCQLYESDFDLKMYNYTNRINVTGDHFHFIYDSLCDSNLVYRLSPTNYEEESFYLQYDGNLYVPFFDNNMYYLQKYCLEVFTDDEMNQELSAIVCPEEANTKFSYGVEKSRNGTKMQYVITQNVKENLLGKLTGVYYQNTHPYTNNRGNCYIFSIILTRELVSRIDLKEVVIFNSLLKCYVSRAASKMFLWLVLINLLIISVSPTYETKCPLVLSLDLTNGTRLKDGTIVSEGISFAPHLQFKHEGSARGCVCEIKRCIRKCCPPGHAMVNRTCQAYDNDFLLTIHDNDVPLAVASDHFHYVHNSKCSQKGFYRLSPAEYEEDAFYVQQDGKMLMPLAAPGNEILNPEKYCVETFVDETMENISALVCFEEEETKVDSMLSCGMIISMPFLLLTFFVYAILPDRNLHGKALMCYVITLFGAYLTLVFIQLYPDNLSDFNCKTLGISCLFFFMVSFFWMNVMSIDIWWAFSGLRGFSGSKKEAERKRFLLYCGYAWGMPFLHVLIVTSLTLSESLPPNAWYNPGMGDGQCWFREGAPTLVYFYGPMALLTISNIVLFCITAWRIKQVQQDTAMLRKDESKKHTYENDKQRFNLYLKLMLAMGVNWSMEIISWIVDWHFGRMPPAVWYLTDFCNALYGVFIFFIFVFKKNIWKLLKRRYYMIMGKPHLARSMTQTAYSPRTTGSSLSQTVTTDKSFVNDSSILTSEVA